MRYKWGLKGMPMGGYNTYTTTQSPINKQQQLLNTLFMTTDLLRPQVRDCLAHDR